MTLKGTKENAKPTTKVTAQNLKEGNQKDNSRDKLAASLMSKPTS